MKKLEAEFTTKINRWLPPLLEVSGPYEVKHTRGKTRFSMAELKEHQKDWLKACSSPQGCTYKIPDTNIGYNPFDVMHYKNAPAYVVIVFPEWTCAIHIQDILFIDSPSLDEETAIQMAAYKVLTKKLF